MGNLICEYWCGSVYTVETYVRQKDGFYKLVAVECRKVRTR